MLLSNILRTLMQKDFFNMIFKKLSAKGFLLHLLFDVKTIFQFFFVFLALNIACHLIVLALVSEPLLLFFQLRRPAASGNLNILWGGRVSPAAI